MNLSINNYLLKINIFLKLLETGRGAFMAKIPAEAWMGAYIGTDGCRAIDDMISQYKHVT